MIGDTIYTIEVTLDFSALALFRKVIPLSLSLLLSILYNCVLLYDYIVGVLCSLFCAQTWTISLTIVGVTVNVMFVLVKCRKLMNNRMVLNFKSYHYYYDNI